MYGLVNKALQDLVVSSAGVDAWRRVMARANITEPEFFETTNYPDEVTLCLVAATSAELDQPAEEILYRFGRHWILFTGREGWESLFSLGGADMKSFLCGLNDMHARVQVAMPGSKMPQFFVTDRSDHLEVEYFSHRSGFAPMVCGIFAGLAERFGEPWEISHVDRADNQEFDTFKLVQAVGLIKNAA